VTAPPFEVHLEVFSGPFDLLLRLIAKHELDVTEVALSAVTDEFVAHVRAAGFDLEQVSEFLVVAATLLDLKAARLLPRGQVVDEEDVARLEARDLLFARVLQYRAYKSAASLLAALAEVEGRHRPRAVTLEARYARALPDVVLPPVARLAALAARLREPPPPRTVPVDHVHVPRVSVREHRLAVVAQLRELGSASFRVLCEGCRETLEVVARFLALLELFRDGEVAFEQVVALGELRVRWTGGSG
jgi:segregation and condensation protein A